MSDNTALLIGLFLVLVFLTVFHRGCLLWEEENNAYWMERFKIEEGVYKNEQAE